jgi:hypothetical protein
VRGVEVCDGFQVSLRPLRLCGEKRAFYGFIMLEFADEGIVSVWVCVCLWLIFFLVPKLLLGSEAHENAAVLPVMIDAILQKPS